ncbi:MAG: ATP-binding protein [Roseiflexaceae bacterium]|nr:ATP-binding protein [Roseiflexaceae bacterium]
MSYTAMADSQTTPVFGSAADHLHAMLGWLHRLLAWQIALTRQTYGALAEDEYRGLYVPDAEVDILAASAAQVPPELLEQRAALERERLALDEAAHAAYDGGADLPLIRLSRLFGLSTFECDLLLLALAPEVDLRYERLYAYIQDDVTKKRPTVDLALRLLCIDAQQRIAVRRAFEADAPLQQQQLLHLFEDGQRHAPLLARFMKLDDRIVAEMLLDGSRTSGDEPTVAGSGRRVPAEPGLLAFTSVKLPQRRFQDLVLPDEFAGLLRRTVVEHGGRLVLALQGKYGSGRGAIAEALCSEAGTPLLAVALDRMAESTLAPFDAMARVLRGAMLCGAAILWNGADRLLRDEAAGEWRAALFAALDAFDGCSFLPLDQSWEARGLLRATAFLRVQIPELTYGEREYIWRARLGELPYDETVVKSLASTFRLTAGQIRDAVAMARTLAHWRGTTVDASALFAACRAQSSGKLDALAHKIHATYSWNDIVLPAGPVEQMLEICVQMRHRSTVLEAWGFDRHLAMGKGINVLFAGQSGTGKTMAAEIIATELGLELYKIDLSSMVSKYIGETEKNLDRVFTAAREANAILFFDEADALFGKRSEVKDAHDRYANIEVGYLLQKMEEYDGVVILATNLRNNMDDAFVRRLHVAIDFPFPEPADRLRIWQRVFPASAPLAADVDLQFLAKQFKLPGGNIRNIALLAAYLAAEDGNSIGMTHIVQSIKREYQKLGKLVTAAEFGAHLNAARA